MAVNNRSTNKVRVTRFFGAGAVVGLIDPKVNMKVRYGQDIRWIVGMDSGNPLQVKLAKSSGGTILFNRAYPHELLMDTTTASGWGWPSNANSVTFGHSGCYPGGVPRIQGTGTTYLAGAGLPTTFGIA
jgi:hypothetical protein